MKFSEFLNEISFFKIKELLNKPEDEIVKTFCTIFKYKEKINVKKIEQGSSAEYNKKEAYITYSSKGLLIHELLHLLQIRNTIYSKDNRYKEFKLDKESFIEYVLQRKELNNQAISVAFSLTELNLTISDFKDVEVPNSLNSLKDRLNFFFYNLNSVKSNRKIDLYKRISKYQEYIVYMNEDYQPTVNSTYSFI